MYILGGCVAYAVPDLHGGQTSEAFFVYLVGFKSKHG